MRNMLPYFILFVIFVAKCSAECHNGELYTFGDHVYCFGIDGENDRQDFWQAREFCLNDGGDLASVTSKEEDDFIHTTINGFSLSGISFWIGMTSYEDVNDEFTWTDGTLVEFEGFSQMSVQWDESHTPRCVYIEHGSNEWTRGNCGRPLAFVCKRPAGDQPPPATIPPPTMVDGYCPRGYIGNGNKCYKAVSAHEADPINIGVTWTQALQRCRNSRDGLWPDLASIENDEENAEVTALLFKDEGNYWFGAFYSRGDIQDYVWTDNSPIMRYNNWDIGHPAVLGSGMIHGYHYHAGMWESTLVRDNIRRGYVCQVKKDPSNIVTSPQPFPCEYCPNNCPLGYQAYWESCYRIESYPRSWSDASSACNNEGGNLVSIHNEVENDGVFFMMREHRDDNRNSWIGMHDSNNDGEYSWSDQWAVTYTHWDGPEPQTSGRCVMLDQKGRWLTNQCDQEAPYVCKVNREEPLVLPPKPTGVCPYPYITEIQGSCFYFSTRSLGWMDAADYCTELNENGKLAYIHHAAESREISIEIRNRFTGINDHSIWIGLYKRDDDEGFRWVDREEDPVEYVNWVDGIPDDRWDYTLIINDFGSHRHGKWDTKPDWHGYQYICKTEKVPAPTAPPGAPGICPNSSWVSYGDECLYFAKNIESEVSWLDAVSECEYIAGENATLVTILDANKDAFVHAQMNIDPSESFWIGLSRNITEGAFSWLETGVPVVYNNWDLEQPNWEAPEYCGAMYADSGRWESTLCDFRKAFVCQVQQMDAPETTGPPQLSTATSSTSTPSSTSSSTSTTTAATTPVEEEPLQGLSGGEIAGIVIGTLLGVTVVAVIGVMLFKKTVRTSRSPFPGTRTDSTRGLNPHDVPPSAYEANHETPA